MWWNIDLANISVWENTVLPAKTLDKAWRSSHLTLSVFFLFYYVNITVTTWNKILKRRKNHHLNDFFLSWFPLICIHIIYPIVVIWPSFDFSPLNLLFIKLNPSAVYEYLAHTLLCVHPKCLFQAWRATMHCSQDPVSFSSVCPAPSTVPATESVFVEWMNWNMYSYVSGAGVVCVCLDCAHTRNYAMQISMFPPQPWALTQSPLVPFVSKQQGIQAENSLLMLQ